MYTNDMTIIHAIWELDFVLRKFRRNIRFSAETCESRRTFGRDKNVLYGGDD